MNRQSVIDRTLVTFILALVLQPLSIGCTGPIEAAHDGTSDTVLRPSVANLLDEQLSWQANLAATRLVNEGYGWPMPGKQRYEPFWIGTVPVGEDVVIPIDVPEDWHLGVIIATTNNWTNNIYLEDGLGQDVSGAPYPHIHRYCKLPGRHFLRIEALPQIELEGQRPQPVAIAASLRPAKVIRELRRQLDLPDIIYAPGMAPPAKEEDEQDEDDNLYGVDGDLLAHAWWTGVIPAGGIIYLPFVPPENQKWAVVAASADGGNVLVFNGNPWDEGDVRWLRRLEVATPRRLESVDGTSISWGRLRNILVRNLDLHSDQLVYLWLARRAEQDAGAGGLRFLRQPQGVSEYALRQKVLVQDRILDEGFTEKTIDESLGWSRTGRSDFELEPSKTNTIRHLIPPGIAFCFAVVSNNQLAHKITLKDSAGAPLEATQLPDGLYTLPPQPRLTVVTIPVTNNSEIEDRVWFYHGYTKYPLASSIETYGTRPAAPFVAQLMSKWEGDGFVRPVIADSVAQPLHLGSLAYGKTTTYAFDVPEGAQLRALAVAPNGSLIQLVSLDPEGDVLEKGQHIFQYSSVDVRRSGRVLLRVLNDDLEDRPAHVWLYAAIKPAAEQSPEE